MVRSWLALSLALSYAALSFPHAALRAASADAQPDPDGGLQALIDARVAGSSDVGIVAGVIDGDAVRIYRSGGSGTGRPLDEHTEFEIGSITKTFTATILASMVLDTSVALTDPVADDLPHDVRVPTRGGKVITLENLATQHSGLPRLPSNFRPADPSDPYADYHASDLYAFLSGYTLQRDPGIIYEYSNLGVGLLGDALAYHAHVPYANLLRTHVLGPLQMNESALVLDARERVRFAAGHTMDEDVLPHWNFDALAPAGGLRSTVADMLAFVRCNLGLGPLARACLFAQQPRETLPGGHIGLVWMTDDRDGIVWHNGATFGFHAAIAVRGDHRKGIVVLSNGGFSVDDLAFHALDASLPVESFAHVERLDAATLDGYAGRYVVPSGNGASFTVGRDGSALAVQFTGQQRGRIRASARDHFFSIVANETFDFTRDDSGRVTTLVVHQRGTTTVAVRSGTSTPAFVPTAAPTARPLVVLDAVTLDEYVGTYRVTPQVAFTIKREGTTLLVQLTGQEFNPVFASAKDHVYYTAVDAQIDFVRDTAGRVSGLVLHQNGLTVPANRE